METITLYHWPDGTPITARDNSWDCAYAHGYDPLEVDHDGDCIHVTIESPKRGSRGSTRNWKRSAQSAQSDPAQK